MAAKSFAIEFGGYYFKSLPEKSGIYCVFSCIHNVAGKDKKATVSLKKLIYIGESKDGKERLDNHEKLPIWQKHLKPGEVLCYSFGPVPATDRIRCEAALIFKHKPPENTEYRDSFPHDETTITLTGETKFLNTNFTIQRTE